MVVIPFEVSRHEVDAQGLSCPMPLLKLKQQIHRMADGEEVVVLATDGGSVRDFEAYCKQAGHTLSYEYRGDCHVFVVRKHGLAETAPDEQVR
ncbi:SirA-like protein [gamma proteobacterium HdN1]|nr:SirA-like protein [gamma proteobacterium HdN1]